MRSWGGRARDAPGLGIRGGARRQGREATGDHEAAPAHLSAHSANVGRSPPTAADATWLDWTWLGWTWAACRVMVASLVGKPATAWEASQMSTVSKLGAVAASVVLLAGCGGGSNDFAKKPPKDIIAAAKTDMGSLTSVHLAGDITNQADKITFDMQVTKVGDCHGTLTVGAGKAEIVSVGGAAWMKPDDAFWKAQAGAQATQIEQVVGDKWVVMPSSASDLSSLCNLDSLLSKLNDGSSGSSSSDGTVKGTSNVNGQDAVELDSTQSGDTLKTWVATGDKHYVVKLEMGGASPGSVNFTEFDKNFNIAAPATSDVVDLSKATG